MEQTLISIIPFFFIIMLGSLLKIFKIANQDWSSVLNKYGLYVAFPAVIIHSLMHTDKNKAMDLNIIVINFILLISIIFIIYLFSKIFKINKSLTNTYIICSFFSNIGFLGYPIISSMIPGSESMISIHISIYNIILFTIGIFILEHSLNHATCKKLIIKKVCTNPLLLSVFIGLTFMLLEIKLPQTIQKTISLVHQSASPVVLFSLGIFIIKKVNWKKDLRHILQLSIIRLLIIPSVFIIVYFLIKPGTNFHISILESAMPLAITPFALSEYYPMEKNIITTTIMVSTVIAIITIPLIKVIIT